MERTRTRLDDFRLHAVHTGAGAPVVLLHGLSGSHRWWRATVAALASRRRVHLPELIGFGGSRRPPRQPDIAELADLLVQWMDALRIERTDFVGHSMGAQVGIHVAALHPDRLRRLVLVSAAGVPRELSPVKAAELAAELIFPRAWGRVSFLPTIAADAARAGPRTLFRATRSLLADDVRPLLPAIRLPTLLIWGEHDPLTPVADGRAMASLLPRARLEVIPRAAHNPFADQPALFNRLLLSFLSEEVAGAAAA